MFFVVIWYMDFENEAAEMASTGKLKKENFVMSKN